MKAKELIKWIQDNGLEEYNVYVGGETSDSCWTPNPSLKCVLQSSKIYEGMHYIEDSGTDNAIVF